MTEDPTLKPTVTLDMRGTSCPAPLIGAKKILFSWSKYTSNDIARTERLPDGGNAYYIRRGRTQRLTPNAVLDLRGVVCPGPLVEAKHLLHSMQPGETLKLVSNCPGIADDVVDWVKATGHKLLETDEVGPGEFEFYIGKA